MGGIIEGCEQIYPYIRMEVQESVSIMVALGGVQDFSYL